MLDMIKNNITTTNNNNESNKEKFYSFFWKPYKKIWNDFFEYIDWRFVKVGIKNEKLWDIIEISKNIFEKLISKDIERLDKNKDIEAEINIALYPEKIENLFLSLIEKLENKKQIIKALDFIKEKHEWQYRDENTPYWTHCVLTSIYIIENWWKCDDIIVWLLHDIVEDQFYEWLLEEIQKLFWKNIVDKVVTLSKIIDWKRIDDTIYYKKISTDNSLLLIKACDRLSNLYGTYYWPDIEWNMNYLFKTKRDIIPLLEKDFPELVNKMNSIILFLRENIKLNEKQLKRIEDLKKIREIREELSWK